MLEPSHEAQAGSDVERGVRPGAYRIPGWVSEGGLA